jgi:hypothetical protein
MLCYLCYKIMEVVIVKLNPEFLWQKLHLKKRGLFLKAKCTWN